ncbi:SDR family NAD(P)-dependent oxidoreductase [Myxococcaceae bacterium GXIMD 01537]
MPDLKELVAVVTGATRGGGRGIALELGAAGATVYVTGRSTRAEGGPGTKPGTIEDVAEAITARGGKGIPVRCDHTDDAQVEALFARVAREQGRLDVLVNNAWGGNERSLALAPFWELSPAHWEDMFASGVRAALTASRLAVPLMLPRRRGLLVTTSAYDRGRYTGHLYYDLAKSALNRLAFGMARDLQRHGIASVALAPGFMRTELVLAAFQTDEARWREVEGLETTETPAYLGRAVAALAGDADVLRRTGETLLVADLAREYGFTDVDGRQPGPFLLPDF